MADTTTQVTTIVAGVGGGVAGYFLGGGRVLWTGVGALVAAVAGPPLLGAIAQAMADAQAASLPAPKAIDLAPGQTIIERASVGDEFLIQSPPGWGAPSATANIPGFLEVEASSATDETTTVKVVAGGQGNIIVTHGSQTAVLSIQA